MQVVACAASIFSIILSFIKMGYSLYTCWFRMYDKIDDNYTSPYLEICYEIEMINTHFFAGGVVIHATLLAISATLAVYCCKVVNCCGPPPKMPVITVQSPPDQQREE
ncbi:hypothetical protein AMECASPLE_028419 [Ameca splendens]|uniref:Uncharacterized protein n=1 Tax=Ameca splendens TaxID=208324 RepID=A0ABV0ZFM1_9TELE